MRKWAQIDTSKFTVKELQLAFESPLCLWTFGVLLWSTRPWDLWLTWSFLLSSVWDCRETGHTARPVLEEVDHGDLYEPASIPGAIMQFVVTAGMEAAGSHHGWKSTSFGSFLLCFGHLLPQHRFPMTVSCHHSPGKHTAEHPHHTQEAQLNGGIVILQFRLHCCLLCI